MPLAFLLASHHLVSTALTLLDANVAEANWGQHYYGVDVTFSLLYTIIRYLSSNLANL